MTGKTIAGKALHQTAFLIDGDRQYHHGDKLENLTNIAEFWNTYLRQGGFLKDEDGVFLDAQDAANMMELFKVARRLTGVFNPDDFLDGAGYAAVGLECTQRLNAGEDPS
tara:strand:- start:465 stop:794 length:330 start_codon:yes stop_codon:yes gene_type:complete